MTTDPKESEPQQSDDDEAGMFTAEPVLDDEGNLLLSPEEQSEIHSMIHDSDWRPNIEGNAEDGFTRRLGELAEKYGLKEPGKEILYPGSGPHAGVAFVFGKDRVLHVDPDERSMQAMHAGGYRTLTAIVEDLEGKEMYDLIVLFNSHIADRNVITKLLKPGGIIVANNWTADANDMAKQPELELIEAYLPYYSDENGSWQSADVARTKLGWKIIDAETELEVTGKTLEDAKSDPTLMVVKKSTGALFVFRKKVEGDVYYDLPG